jgi:nitrate reductase beta subunit
VKSTWSKRQNLAVLKQVGLTVHEVEDMYHVMAIANYEDRFVIPRRTANTPKTPSTYGAAAASRSAMAARTAPATVSIFGGKKPRTIPIKAMV